MSQRKNIFDSPLTTALDSLADLAIAASATSSAMKAANTAVRSSIEAFDKLMAKYHNEKLKYFMGVALAVPDYHKSKKWLMSRAHRPRSVVREEIIQLNEEIGDRLRSQLLCAGYEILEDYLREVAAQCFYLGRGEHRKERLSLPFRKGAFHAKYPSVSRKGGVNSPAYFRAYVDYTYKNGLIQFLQELDKCLLIAQEQPDYSVALNELIGFYRLIEYCRHVTVHEFGRHDLNRLKSLNRWMSLDHISRMSFLKNERMILLTNEAIRDFIRVLSGIAFHVYCGVSDAYGMDDDYFGRT